MGQRLSLQALLKTLTDTVYFDPPAEDRMTFPCIVYEIDEEYVDYADNNPYNLTLGYQVTVIAEDPDTDIRGKLSLLPMSKLLRHFVSDGLHHYVYKTFF